MLSAAFNFNCSLFLQLSWEGHINRGRWFWVFFLDINTTENKTDGWLMTRLSSEACKGKPSPLNYSFYSLLSPELSLESKGYLLFDLEALSDHQLAVSCSSQQTGKASDCSSDMPLPERGDDVSTLSQPWPPASAPGLQCLTESFSGLRHLPGLSEDWCDRSARWLAQRSVGHTLEKAGGGRGGEEWCDSSLSH